MALTGKWSSGNKEVLILINTSGKITVFFSDDGVTSRTINTTNVITANVINTISVSFTSGNYIIDLNGIIKSGVVSYTTLYQGTENLEIGSYNGGSAKFDGNMYYLKAGTSEFNFAEGGEAYLYNTGTGANALVTGAVLNNFRAGRQDVYHYNITKGFDLYTDGSENEIKVPVGKTCETAGYTFTSTHPSGRWHNGAETKIQFPASLATILATAGCPNPLDYDSFEEDFSNVHLVFSNIEDKKKRSILIYNTAQTGANLDKIRRLLGIIIPALNFSNENNSSYIPLI